MQGTQHDLSLNPESSGSDQGFLLLSDRLRLKGKIIIDELQALMKDSQGVFLMESDQQIIKQRISLLSVKFEALKEFVDIILESIKSKFIYKKLHIEEEMEKMIDISTPELYLNLEISQICRELPPGEPFKYLRNFVNLQNLKLELNLPKLDFVKDLSYLKQLKTLKLFLTPNVIDNIKPLVHLKEFHNLNMLLLWIDGNQIEDISEFINLPLGLDTLAIDMSRNPITKINSLALLGKMVNLKNLHLNLHQTKINSLDTLQELGKLRELRVVSINLTNTQIRLLSDLDRLIQNNRMLEHFEVNTRQKNITDNDFYKQLLNHKFLRVLIADVNEYSFLDELQEIFATMQVTVVKRHEYLPPELSQIRSNAFPIHE